MGERGGRGPVDPVRISRSGDIPAALDRIGLRPGRSVVVLVGGAGGMGEREAAALARVLQEGVVPVVERHDAVVIDGGTAAGVMRLIGRARSATGAGFPLVGVAAEGTVRVPGAEPRSADAADLEPNHTAVLLVPGDDWGDEAPWIVEVTGAVAGGRPSVTVLANGGEIAYTDAAGSLSAGRPVLVLAGSGRTADAVAGARSGHDADRRALDVAASPLTHVVDMTDAGAVSAALDAILATASGWEGDAYGAGHP
jgi:SLOG in TRPM, prokaryote